MRSPVSKSYCFLAIALAISLGSIAQDSKAVVSEEYQCTPCGSDCDKGSYKEAGKCPNCQMALVKKSTVTFKSIPSSKVCAYIKDHPDVVVLDVRTKNEYEGKSDNYGTLQNAINIPIQELESRMADISNLKDKEVIVYCSHSRRSPRASYILTQNGFTHVINMEGGMSSMNDNTCKK